jgi:predicted dehydrogenase
LGGKVRWGVLGTGKIARIVANALAASRDGAVVAVGSRNAARADAFARQFGVPRPHPTYEGLVEDAEVDLIYVATHHPSHREWAVRAAEMGKHVLCEKPIAVNAAEASDIVEAARSNDVFLLEAFAYRCHPQTGMVVDLLRDGAVGEVRMVDAEFGYDAGSKPDNYLMVHELAGGAILDVGCYTTSMAHLVASVATGTTPTETVNVAGAASIGPTQVDHLAAATLVFEGGLLARVACSIQATFDSAVRIYGSDGSITVPSPWLPGRIGPVDGVVVRRPGREPEAKPVPVERDVYTVEVDAVNAFVRAGERSPPVMSWAESLANMRTLDRWRASVGLLYDGERIN